ncbi:MAG: nucleoside deaminase [Candidatus Cloacimonetes bacterium]|jgi:tRNA(Arg) A34 adenosine deaminase TadA|nr:nucleoside deaminase [Candidatus Cloacimonadota bacterium]
MNDRYFLHLAIEKAKESSQVGGFPAGAVVVKNGEVISSGVSVGAKLNDPTSHAETVAIREACAKLKTIDLSGATLYASLQPCLMCFSVANWAGISRIVFGCKKTIEMAKKNYYEGENDIAKINELNNRQIELVYLPDYEAEMIKVVNDWEKKLAELP